MRCKKFPGGLQAQVCPIQIQFPMFGLLKFRGDRLTRRSMQSGVNHYAALDDEEVPGDGMIVPGQGLLGCGAHAGFRLRCQFFRREGRQRLPLPFKRLDAQPQQPARGCNNRDDVNQDGAPIETRHLTQFHSVGDGTTRLAEEKSRIVT